MKELNKVFIALDQMSVDTALEFCQKNSSWISHLKIGLELFLLGGQPFLQEILKIKDFKIFLDLKLHDIPQTVYGAIRSLSLSLDESSIDYLTIHLSGGSEMINKALEARNHYLPNTKLLGVSLLTSLDEKEIKNIFNKDREGTFLRLSEFANQSGLDGIILSPRELEVAAKNKQLLKVCPGIRFANDHQDDQKRTMTPKDALTNGADFLVMGRSLTRCPSEKEKVQKLQSLS